MKNKLILNIGKNNCNYSAKYIAIYYENQQIYLKLYNEDQSTIYQQIVPKGTIIKYLDENKNEKYIIA